MTQETIRDSHTPQRGTVDTLKLNCYLGCGFAWILRPPMEVDIPLRSFPVLAEDVSCGKCGQEARART